MDGVELVGSVRDGASAIRAVAELRPDLVVIGNAVRWTAPSHADGARPSVINRRTPLEAGAPAQTKDQ